MKKKTSLVLMMFLATFCLFLATFDSKVLADSEDEVITKGVYIDSVDIGGMTTEEAKAAVQEYINELQSKTLSVSFDNNIEVITLGELDYKNVESHYIADALQIGKSGNLIKRYKELKDTEATNMVFNLEFTLSNEKVKAFLEEKSEIYDIEAKNATVKRESGQFIYTDHAIGQIVDIEETAAAIKAAVTQEWNQEDVIVIATIKEDIPEYTKEMVEKCNTILGTFTTNYTSSSADRAGNLANGARLINNTVLYPGDVFSAYEKLTPFTMQNGYYQAGAYANGKVVDSIGGGACQVTTTLYNAVLLSELEVVERAAHSMTISYVDLSKDAAIAGTWKDLKFKNDTKTPIVIEVYTQGRSITFNIWGDETRDTNTRKIKFETVVLGQTAPGADVITEDDTKPITYKVTTQSAHTGYVAELYKIVYENGIEVSRTRVNKSVYNASPKYVTVGTIEPEEEEPEEEIPEDEIPEDELKEEKPSSGDEANQGSQAENNSTGTTPKGENSTDGEEAEDNVEEASSDGL